ncbi:hypothetical protein HanRHA438_Chr09g0417701 [Helianthus annuus]|nr:hypothetical protein HanHA300_Chr09g0333141 [Helianthus annuus]KAJ0536045.1 hypothetical protein HanIR_Chr09g0437231 [Helianthus annuus]KAJ0543759.1 hypothetical protein HanHA89_Chr09g0354121 [Helianthus annuus]KAJ0708813.1 hypothetical protein HanLR1_Chr09g0333431 [Helianthus annuus]KAJ0712723.1 hypothetical protein HanOQP8_Chr09g0337911 [Helianthus annuus]
MNLHQPANLHFLANGMHLYSHILYFFSLCLIKLSFFKFRFVFLSFIFNFNDVIGEFVPNFEYGFIAYYNLDYYHDGFNVSMQLSYVLYITMNQVTSFEFSVFTLI